MLKEFSQFDSSVSKKEASESDTRQTPFFHLEISRGRTRFPLRPVTSKRFLIGTGAECHLQLGGPEVPILHSQICVDDEVYLERVADSPLLRVNGKSTHWAVLQEGDEIEINGFGFVVHAINRPLLASTNSLTATIPDSLSDSEQRCPETSEMSALELVEHIEQEEALLEEFEAGRQMGADALIQAAAHRALTLQDDVSPQPDENGRPGEQYDQVTPEAGKPFLQVNPSNRPNELQLLNRIESVLDQLTEITENLTRQSRQISQRENHYAEAIELLFEVQQKLALQIETLLNQSNSPITLPVPPEKTQDSVRVA